MVRKPSRSTAVAAALALAASAAAGPALAYSFGAPVCEVQSLPVLEMSTTLSDPAPAGWRLHGDYGRYYLLGRPQRFTITHPDPDIEVRGALVWAKAGENEGAGSFALPESGGFQHVPAPADCGEWAMTHTSASPKALDRLRFEWNPMGEERPVIVRAFLVEECDGLPGTCRDHQALTPVLQLLPALFVDGFGD